METQAYFENIREQIQTRLSAAKMEIDLAVAWFTDRTLFDLICEKAKRGVKVRLLIFDDDINKHLPLANLETHGGKIFRVSEKLMHNKFCVIDRDVVITGSYNWTYKAHNENHENISITTGNYVLALQYVQEFNKIVDTHCVEEKETTIDYKQIIKRLELMKQLIELGDTDDLATPYRKLKALNLPKVITDILKLIEMQQYKDASVSITDFISRFKEDYSPKYALDYLKSGNIKYINNDIENAKLDINKAIELDTKGTVTYCIRGISSLHLCDFKGAILNFDKAIELDSEFAYIYILRGNTKKNLGDFKGAILDFDKVIELEPGDVIAYNIRGGCKDAIGDYRGAISDFNKVIDLNTVIEAEDYFNRGSSKLNIKDYKGAISDFDKVIEIDPNDSIAYNNRGISKCNLNDYAGAIADYDKAIELDPNDELAKNNRDIAIRKLKELKDLKREQAERSQQEAERLRFEKEKRDQAFKSQQEAERVRVEKEKREQAFKAQQEAERVRTEKERRDQAFKAQQEVELIRVENEKHEQAFKAQQQESELIRVENEKRDQSFKAQQEAERIRYENEKREKVIAEKRQNENSTFVSQSTFKTTTQTNAPYTNNLNGIVGLLIIAGVLFFGTYLIIVNHQKEVPTTYTPQVTVTEPPKNVEISKSDNNEIKNVKVENQNHPSQSISKDADFYCTRGYSKVLEKDHTGAISDFDKAIELDSKYAIAYHNRGIAKDHLQDYSGAISDYNKAIELDTKYNFAYLNRGIAKRSIQDYKGAISDYDKAIDLDPKFALAYNNRGDAKYFLQDYKGAISDYDKAIEINHKSVLAYNNRGNAKDILQDYNGAISDYDKAIELDPKFKLAQQNKNFSLQKLNQLKNKDNNYINTKLPNYSSIDHINSSVDTEKYNKATPKIVVSLRAVTMCNGEQLKDVLYSLTEIESGNNDTRTLDTYIAKLGLRKNYILTGSKYGYNPESFRFSTDDITSTTTIEKILTLKAVER